jgi:hypothetical protein
MKMGNKVYCSREHSGFGRRSGKTVEQKKTEKAAYDKIYSKKNFEIKKPKRAAYHKKTYKGERRKRWLEYNRKRYPQHLEYLNTPKYKEWKRDYDKKYLSKKDYGIFWESALLLNELEELLIKNRSDGTKFRMGITNKTQKRKRLWQRTKKQQKNSLQQI